MFYLSSSWFFEYLIVSYKVFRKVEFAVNVVFVFVWIILKSVSISLLLFAWKNMIFTGFNVLVLVCIICVQSTLIKMEGVKWNFLTTSILL